MGFLSDLRTAVKNQARPEAVYIEPGPVALPAIAAGVLWEAFDFGGSSAHGDRRYAEVVVTNNSGDYIDLVMSSGQPRRVFDGQSIIQTFTPPVSWYGIKPNSATAAGDIVVVPKIRVMGA